MAVYGKQADVNANQGRNVLLYTPDTKLTAQDTFLGGTGTGVTDEMLNGAKRIYGNTAQDTANAYGATLNVNNTPRYDSTQDTASIQDSLKQAQSSYMTNQKALLDSALSTQLAKLQNVYSQAISDGQISIRDAQDQYATQKATLEQQAYQNSEKTNLYSQDMGIQNSQQAIGLMQGDQARANSLSNQNMTARDKQINDIKSRLQNITNQNSISMVDAQAQHDYGLAQAQGTADMNYANGLVSLKTDALNANRAQQNNLDGLAVNDIYAKQNASIANDYQNALVDKQQKYTVDNMYTQGKLDMEKLQKSFENDVAMAGVQFGYSSKLQSQAGAQAMAQIGARLSADLQAQQAKTDYENAQLQKTFLDSNSPEYKIREAQLKDASKVAQGEIYAKAVATANITLAQSPEPVSTVPKPTVYPDARPVVGSVLGNTINWLNNLGNSSQSAYDAEQNAIQRWNNAHDAVYGKK